MQAVTLTLVHVLARFAHLLVFLGIGNVFGANATTDSVLLLQAPLLVIMAVTAGAADMVVMPVMHRAAQGGDADGLPRLIWLWALKWTVPITVATLLISTLWVADGAWQIAPLLLPLPLLSTSSAVFMGLLNAQGRFYRAAISPLFGAMLAGPFFFLPSTATNLALILLLFEIGRCVGLGLPLGRSLAIRDSDQRHAGLMLWAVRGARWQSLGSFCTALNMLVNTLIASRLSPGILSQIEYASRLWNMVPLLFAGFLTLMHADFSRRAAAQSLQIAYIHRQAGLLLLLAMATAAGCYWSSPWIARLLYGVGQMDVESVESLGDILSLYFLGAIPLVPGLLYVKALSAQGRVKLVGVISMISVPLNVVCTLLFVEWLGAIGIPLALLCILSFKNLLYWRSI